MAKAISGIRSLIRLTGCMLLAAAVGGCGVGDHQASQRMMAAYTAHEFDRAIDVARQSAGSRKPHNVGRHQLRWRLEEGALWRAKGDWLASEQAFEDADIALEVIDARPVVSLTGEGAATLSNLAALPYEGYAYDRIMLSTYRALNALKLGDIETARVELNRVHDRQRQAVEANERRIAKAETEAREQEKQGRIRLDHAQDRVYRQLDPPEVPHAELYQAQGRYINPFSELLQGLYFLYASASSSDHENAVHALRRVAAIVGEHNAHIQRDLAIAESVAGGGAAPGNVTYVIFETGRAPSREQVQIHIPLAIRGIDYVGAAFPKLVFHGNHERRLYIEHAGGFDETASVADMDTIVSLEFRNELPLVITRTILNTTVQATAHYALHEATRDQDLANVAARLAGMVYRATMAQADRRTWLTLPKQFQYARLDTPEDRTLVLRTPGGQRATVKLEPGEVNVVYVKSIMAGRPLRIAQFTLR